MWFLGPSSELTLQAVALAAIVAAGCADTSSGRAFADQDTPLDASGSGCFVLPAASEGLTRSYRVRGTGSLEPLGDVAGNTHHMRAAFHPEGHHVYVSALNHAARDRYIIHVRTFGYDRTDCSIGPLVASTEIEDDTASNSRIYGLVAHPNGRWLYQTTGSSGRIRLFYLGPDGVPVLRTSYDVTQGGTLACAETRRLALGADGERLYSNCNNADAGQGADHALQVWDIRADGALDLVQHHVLSDMDGGIADPVLHPSGRWLYQPAGTSSRAAPQGPGAYVLIFALEENGALRPHASTAVRVLTSQDSVRSLANTQLFPSTFIIHSEGTAAYVTVHAALDFEAFPHEIVRYRIEGDGGDLLEIDRRPAALPTQYSSHHGGVLIGVEGNYFLYSYLTDYDSVRGGVLQQYRIGNSHDLQPLDPPYVATGLGDARQPIVAR